MPRSNWKDLFSNSGFTGSQSRVSGALGVVDGESVEFEFTGATASLSAVEILFDPAAPGAALLAQTGQQATAPSVATIPHSVAIDFSDVVGAVLSPTPRLGRVHFIADLGEFIAEALFPYRAIYLKCTSLATLTLSVRARVTSPTGTDPAIVGSVT